MKSLTLVAVGLFVLATVQLFLSTRRLPLSSSAYSAHVCFRASSASVVCRFRNVCVTKGSFHDKRELQYFLSRDDNALNEQNISDLMEENILLPLRPFSITDRMQGLDEPHNFLAVKASKSKMPRKSLWIDKTAVLYSPFWPENWGHAVFDDLYSIWCSLEIFGIKGSSSNIYHSGFPFTDKALRIRSNEIYNEFSKRARLTAPIDLHILKLSRYSNSICFHDLLTGTGALSMREYPYQLQEFARLIRRDAVSLRRFSSRINIIFLDKTDGKHNRQIMNIRDVVDATSKAFSTASVRRLDSSKLAALRLRARLQVISEIDILITPAGAASFNAAFMRPGSALIVLDVFQPSSNSSVPLEPYIWNVLTDVRTFFFKVAEHDMVVTGESTERLKSDPLYKDFLFRDFAGYQLPVNRLHQVLQTALDHVTQFAVAI